VTEVLVFDNTPLSHFARAGYLDELEKVVGSHRCVTPSHVASEITAGIPDHPALAKVLTAPWLEVVELVDLDEVVAFAGFKAELGGTADENNGESAVLGWVKTHGGTAIIDERAATRIANREKLSVHGSLWLVVNALKAGHLERPAAERLVDDLAATDMRLPVDGAGLLAWAYTEDLLP
jgi:predicted nucleic acid-binding protein